MTTYRQRERLQRKSRDFMTTYRQRERLQRKSRVICKLFGYSFTRTHAPINHRIHCSRFNMSCTQKWYQTIHNNDDYYHIESLLRQELDMAGKTIARVYIYIYSTQLSPLSSLIVMIKNYVLTNQTEPATMQYLYWLLYDKPSLRYNFYSNWYLNMHNLMIQTAGRVS